MAETADEPINHKTCSLKTSIHCEGCKRKVKKILSQVQGVNFVDVDIKLQKVTVTMSGNVEADILIKKLLKSGKPAELWPEKAEKKEKISEIGKNKEKLAAKTQCKIEIDRQQAKPTSDINAIKENEPSGKVEKVQHPASSSSVTENGEKTGDEANVDGGAVTSNEETGGVSGKVKVISDFSVHTSGRVQETKSEGKKTVEGCSAGGDPPTAAETSSEEGVTAGKKKKKKGQNGNLSTTVPSSAATLSLQLPTNQSPPHHHGHHCVPLHNCDTPPPAVYGVSSNTAHPTSSYTASYYATPPPYSYSYSYPEPPPPSSHPQQPLDSFEIFSDENPNGCTIA